MTDPKPFEHAEQYSSPASKMILLHGDQKSGKTCTVASFPLEWKIHIIDFDGGLEPFLLMWEARGGKRDAITVAPASNFLELHSAMWHIPPAHHLYVLDTYTAAMKRFKAHITTKMGSSIKDLTDWGKVGGQMSAMAIDYLDHWRDQVGTQGAWGLIICQDKTKDVGNGILKLAPDLVGAASRDASGMCNFLLHLEQIKEAKAGSFVTERKFRTAEDATVMAGDRSLALATHEPADFTALIQKIETKRRNPSLRQMQNFSNPTKGSPK